MLTPDERVALLHSIKREIEKLIPRGEGFTLLLYPHNAVSTCCYISNSERNDSAGMLLQLLMKWDNPVIRKLFYVLVMHLTIMETYRESGMFKQTLRISDNAIAELGGVFLANTGQTLSDFLKEFES